VVLSDDDKVSPDDGESGVPVSTEEVDQDGDEAFVQVQHGQTGRKKKRGPDTHAGNRAKR